MSSEEKCQLCGCVGYSDHREGPEEVSCVCERDWVTVVHQHSSALFLNRSDTSGSPCTSRHTGEPCEGCAHRRSSAKHSQTRTGGLAGKNTHKHSGLYYIGHDSSCIKQKDGDRCLGGEKRPWMGNEGKDNGTLCTNECFTVWTNGCCAFMWKTSFHVE